MKAPFAVKPELEAAMVEIRALATLGRAARESASVKVRQPLGAMICVTGRLSADATAYVSGLAPLLMLELNLKKIEFATSADSLVSLEAKPNFRTLGKRWGKETPRAAAAVAALDSETLRAFEHGTPVVISVDGTDHDLLADEVSIQRRASGALVVQEDGTRFAALDPAISPELRQEGLAREVVSRVQRMRKETGLHVSDRIRLEISGPEEVRDAVDAHREWIAGEVLAESLVTKDTTEVAPSAVAVDLDGITAHIALTKDR